ncbi:MAG: threonine-phosphate decarboxylase CobD [Candidatus Obscuribacterales bacterium]|nr:threonine-phosphate decarboxylase CobD [Candidatus Obscuribacterales bacterium]
MLEHGGDLIAAARKYKRPLPQWLDLSTGINPVPYEVPAIPADVWRRLPQDKDGLRYVASSYYGTDSLLAISGSQAAIQSIPQLFKRARVGLLLPSYNEHKHAWIQAGHEIIELQHAQINAQCSQLQLDVLLLCNPNNPTGDLIGIETIEECLSIMKKKEGTVLVDEAFMDSTPEKSVLPLLKPYPDNLIVLRSLGKFFGLAGARVGFVAASTERLSTLREKLGPWTISGPSRFVACHALKNTQWQESNRNFLKANSKLLIDVLAETNFPADGYTDYFAWVKHRHAQQIHEALCKAGIFTRYFPEPSSIRFGLPHTSDEFLRLRQQLSRFYSPCP